MTYGYFSLPLVLFVSNKDFFVNSSHTKKKKLHLKASWSEKITEYLVPIQVIITQILCKNSPKMKSNLKQNRQKTQSTGKRKTSYLK